MLFHVWSSPIIDQADCGRTKLCSDFIQKVTTWEKKMENVLMIQSQSIIINVNMNDGYIFRSDLLFSSFFNSKNNIVGINWNKFS